jgi:hypothetical protein
MSPDDGRSEWAGAGERLDRLLPLLRQAVTDRDRVFCWHQQGLLAFCPHVFGRYDDDYYVLGFIVVGRLAKTRDRHKSPDRWLWLKVTDIRGAHVAKGTWWSAPRDSRPPFPGLIVEVEAAEPPSRPWW